MPQGTARVFAQLRPPEPLAFFLRWRFGLSDGAADSGFGLSVGLWGSGEGGSQGLFNWPPSTKEVNLAP